jgi:DNA-binding response OmpR family regulator
MAHILLIEDAENLAEIIRQELQKTGHSVSHTLSGEEGLSFLLENEVDLVILDWMLPGMDGLAVLREIQKTSSIPVLMLTARTDELDKILGLELGAEDYMTKPFSMRELITRIHVILRRATKGNIQHNQESAHVELTWKALRLDTAQHQVWINQQNIVLSPTEFNLLELFLRHPGRVYNRAYLMEIIWEQDYIPGDRSIDNAILRLRKKITPLGEAIESVWGIGYRFNDGPLTS